MSHSSTPAYAHITREEALKIKVADDFFPHYDYTTLKDIDFVICKGEGLLKHSLLWAEAKKGVVKDINESFVQLILTIGKARAKLDEVPPKFLGAFDTEKIAFIPYNAVLDVFNQNDFNWNVTPSNYNTKEFKQLYALVQTTLENSALLYNFNDKRSLKEFIKNNFSTHDSDIHKIHVDRNNFTFVFEKWSRSVYPSININWEESKKEDNIVAVDFFLADLISDNNKTLKEKLSVVLNTDHYLVKIPPEKHATRKGLFQRDLLYPVDFKDKQKAHTQFWNIYERPPKEEYWDYIISRRDLLVPQDIRERKGSFFTPQIWVEKSRDYLTQVLGENWQDEYYIWDCAAGTGNLLTGLTNYRHVWASTLDDADVKVMLDMAKNGHFLFENHIFQFDFLNDDLNGDKCPDALKAILNDPEKRKKLIIYINPPYAEATNTKTRTGTGSNRERISKDHKIHNKYFDEIGVAANEIFALFLIRIKKEIQGCILAQFSTLKIVQGPNFVKFRQAFCSELKSLFVVPANTFDNVKGQFPIGFFIWDTTNKEITGIKADVFNANGEKIDKKRVFVLHKKDKTLNQWIKTKYINNNDNIGFLHTMPPDFQNNVAVYIINNPPFYKKNPNFKRGTYISEKNLFECVIYFSTRHCIPATWLNDRDQFLYPDDSWQDDTDFHTNCLIFTLFHGQNRISAEQGVNHWIPFTERDIGCKSAFASDFMSRFIAGKIKPQEQTGTLLTERKSLIPTEPLIFSEQAQAVFDAGRELWTYYHAKQHYGQNININASYYDIRKYFQGETNGKMNKTSNDEAYNELLLILKEKMKNLAKEIEKKVYLYKFLLP